MSRERDEDEKPKKRRYTGPGPLELAYAELARRVASNEARAEKGLPPVYKPEYGKGL